MATATKKAAFKKNAAVTYKARVKTGAGKVVAVRESGRGEWYDVKDSKTGEVLALRASQLTAA